MTSEPENDALTDRPPGSERKPSFMRRWSRHKAHAQDPGRVEADDEGRRLESRPEERPPEDESQPTDADMPSLESLGEGSDYRGFLSPRVSQSLRRAALRKLFQSPRFNIRDGLDDYDGDYTRYTPLGDTVTAHSKFHAERLRERLRAKADSGDAEQRTAANGNSTHAQGDRQSGDRAGALSGEPDPAPPNPEAEGAPRDDSG